MDLTHRFTRAARTIAASCGALAVFTAGAFTCAPQALSQEVAARPLTPGEVAGDTPLAEVHEGAMPDTKFAWRKFVDASSNLKEMWAYSPSMGRNIPLLIVTPADNSLPRPTIYLLNGGDGGEGEANWLYQTDLEEFYADKNVNVVIPMDGEFSYYTDWIQDVPNLDGKQTWETFLTKELPGPLEKALGASNERAVMGLSMSATTSLIYPEHLPGFYTMAGSFSGCAGNNDAAGAIAIAATLNSAKTNIEAMWGPQWSETRVYNDALINAEKLRGTTLYISNGSGLSGSLDQITNPRFNNNTSSMLNTQIVGGVIEGTTNYCTHLLKAKLDSYGIPADWNFRNTGTHQWSYWELDMHDSWSTFDRVSTTNKTEYDLTAAKNAGLVV